MKKIMNHVKESNISKNSSKMTIKSYRNLNDIDVQFEDGTVVTTTYFNFISGNVK